MTSLPVSVIIPCYNRELLVATAIDSALAEGAEVIVVDDGSTDRSWAVIQGYGDRITAVRIENQGPSTARNEGLARATRPYVQFLDSDDLLVAGSMRAMLQVAHSLDPDIIPFGRTKRSGDLTEKRKTGLLCSEDILSAYVGTTEPFYRRAILSEVGGFDPDLWASEDHHLAVKLLASGRKFMRFDVVTNEIRACADDRLSLAASSLRHQRLALDKIADLLAGPQFRHERLVHSRLVWAAGRDCARAGLVKEAAANFRLAYSLGGRRAENASSFVKLLYRIIDPIRAENWVEKLKLHTSFQSTKSRR